MEARREIERAVICAAFAGPEHVYHIATRLHDGDFTDATLRAIWRTLVAMADTVERYDPLLVLERIESGRQIVPGVGIQTLLELSGSHWEAAHIDQYCDRLRQYTTTDDARKIGEQLAGELAIDRTILDSYINRLDAVQRDKADEISTASQAVDSLIDRRQHPQAIHRTGIAAIDQRIRGGLRDGQLVVVGGRPGTGKSVLMMQMAAGIADGGTGALVISLEMLKEEIVDRLSKTRGEEIIRAMPLYFIDSTSDLTTILALVRVACRRYRIGIIVVDYLQLAEATQQRGENRERQIATISRRLKRLAMDIQKPIVVGSQLNRESTKRGKPTLADLRESGAIEQDADIVILLSKSEDGPESLIDIAKHRGGGTSEIQMRLNGPCFQFEADEQDLSWLDRVK